jgi:hypothetical protein
MTNLATTNRTELTAAGYTVTTLKTRKARKGETHFTSAPAQGAGRVNRELTQTGNNLACTGAGWVGGQGGYGKEMICDLDGAIKNFNKVAKAARRQEAIDRRNGIA